MKIEIHKRCVISNVMLLVACSEPDDGCECEAGAGPGANPGQLHERRYGHLHGLLCLYCGRGHSYMRAIHICLIE